MITITPKELTKKGPTTETIEFLRRMDEELQGRTAVVGR